MEIRQLKYFTTVAETLHFTRAAARLNISSSPLSRSIQQLEKEIGAALFDRGTRSVELTATGQLFLPYAQRLIKDYESIQAEFLPRGRQARHIQIGFRSLPLSLLQTVRDAVLSAAEGASTKFHASESIAQLEQIDGGRLDLGLVSNLIDPERFGYHTVLREASALALPDMPRFSSIASVTPDDIADLRLIVQRGVSLNFPSLRPFIAAAREVEQVNHEIVGGISAMIALGDACCLTVPHPEHPWFSYLSGPGVLVRPLHNGPGFSDTHLVWRLDRETPQDLGPIVEAIKAKIPVPRVLSGDGDQKMQFQSIGSNP